MKKCSKCEVEKDLSQFYKLNKSKDGHRPECKECSSKVRKREEWTLDYEAKRLATNILRRLKEINKPRNKCYIGIECKIGSNTNEVANNLIKHFKQDLQELLDKKVKPSIDRIDSKKHYEIDNIRITTIKDNVLDGLKKANEVNKVKIKAMFNDGKVEEYDSISEASKKIKIKRDTIYAHIDKQTKTRKGIMFERIEQ